MSTSLYSNTKKLSNQSNAKKKKKNTFQSITFESDISTAQQFDVSKLISELRSSSKEKGKNFGHLRKRDYSNATLRRI